MNYENYPILIYDMTIISLVVYTGVYPNADNGWMMWRCSQMQLFDAEKLSYVQIIVIIIPTWIVDEF